MGAAVSLFYTGVFPQKVSKLVAIEGMKIPDEVRARMDVDIWESTASWITAVREGSRRQPRRYASIDEAAARMQKGSPISLPSRHDISRFTASHETKTAHSAGNSTTVAVRSFHSAWMRRPVGGSGGGSNARRS